MAAVVLYHFGVSGFGGGFVGVDVFFVISGFLMSGIVVRDLEAGRFSLWAFYRARARRILPALVVLCAVLLVMGWWLLIPTDYKTLGRHVIASIFFASNHRYRSEAGYFDTASHEKWLLHTWSLSVEWQFYMLLPLALWLAWKCHRGRALMVTVLAAAWLASFDASLTMTRLHPTDAFYLLPTRAWEMLLGGLVYFVSAWWAWAGWRAVVLELIGFALMIGSVVVFDSATPWPGWRALMPVMGGAAVLLAHRSGSWLTGGGWMQWLGTRSYSIYLWHWPMVVALGYLGVRYESGTTLAGVAATLVLGHLSHRWVESAAMGSSSALGLSRRQVAMLLASGVAVAAWGAVVKSQDGVAARFSPLVGEIAKEALNQNPRRRECIAAGGVKSPSCVFGGPKVRVVMLGDSHADAVVTALAAALPHPQDGVLDWTYASCPTLLGVKNLSPSYRPEERCGDFLQWVLTRLPTLPKDVPLVIVNRSSVYAKGHNEPWEHDAGIPGIYFTQPPAHTTPAFLAEYAQRLTDTACQLARDRPVYLVRPIPEMGVDVPSAMARARVLGWQRDISIPLSEYHQRHDFVWVAQDEARARCGVKILDPLPYLCRDGRCHGSKDGFPSYYDDDHLSERGNKLLVPMFAQIFR